MVFPNQLDRYVRLMVTYGSEATQQQRIKQRVEGIIIGELRAVASNMSVEEICKKTLSMKMYANSSTRQQPQIFPVKGP